MIFRHSRFAKAVVTFRADKRRVCFLLFDLVIQNAAAIGGLRDVTSFGSATGTQGNDEGLSVKSVHRGHVMTIRAVDVWVVSTLMPKSAG